MQGGHTGVNAQEGTTCLFSRFGWVTGFFFLGQPWSYHHKPSQPGSSPSRREGMIFTQTNLGCICTKRKGIGNGTWNLTGNQSLPLFLSLKTAQSHLGRVEAAASEERCVLTLQVLDVTTKTPGGIAGCNQSASAEPWVEGPALQQQRGAADLCSVTWQSSVGRKNPVQCFPDVYLPLTKSASLRAPWAEQRLSCSFCCFAVSHPDDAECASQE